jgi:hypothetical protein
MLEFIILGEVPGTSFRITFSQVLVVAAMMLIAGELRVASRRREQQAETKK